MRKSLVIVLLSSFSGVSRGALLINFVPEALNAHKTVTLGYIVVIKVFNVHVANGFCEKINALEIKNGTEGRFEYIEHICIYCYSHINYTSNVCALIGFLL